MVGINKKNFSDIKHNHIPKKFTVIRMIFALELSFEDAMKLLEKANYSLSPSSDFDLIVTHFIATRNFSTSDIDEELFKRNLPTIFSEK